MSLYRRIEENRSYDKLKQAVINQREIELKSQMEKNMQLSRSLIEKDRLIHSLKQKNDELMKRAGFVQNSNRNDQVIKMIEILKYIKNPNEVEKPDNFDRTMLALEETARRVRTRTTS